MSRENATFVFHDVHGRRWPRLKKIFLTLGIGIFITIVLFVRVLLVRPDLHNPHAVPQLKFRILGLSQAKSPRGLPLSKLNNIEPQHSKTDAERLESAINRLPNENPDGKIILGFLGNKDQAGVVSLERHAEEFTHLSPEWLFIKNENCELELKPQREVEKIAETHQIKILPLLTNYYDGWRADLIETLITSSRESQDAFIQSAIRLVQSRGYAGITVDFEEVAVDYKNEFNRFLSLFALRCHREKLQFILCTPVGWDIEVFDLDRLSEHVDYFIGMLYHQNSKFDPPGPLASQPWFEHWLKRLLEFGHRDQWIIGIGTFGCDWGIPASTGKVMGFAEIMTTADHAHLPYVGFDESLLNPTFTYQENAIKHTVWFLDAVTALNQARAAYRADVPGLAIWRLGTEDPKLWSALHTARESQVSQAQLDDLGTLDPENNVVHLGDGEIVRATENLRTGFRSIRALKRSWSATYNTLPSYTLLEHHGMVNPNWVALTFDDGPDERWTPQILDILREKNVRATFFVVGQNVEKYPALVKRIFNEGHEIGNHSYTHSNLAKASELQVDLELNATQRLLEKFLGHSTLLFRPPFMADSRPQTRLEVLPILKAQELGYITVCENIDPEDWGRPGAKVLLERLKQQRNYGSVVLLHDGGGNRAQTVEALPHMIDWLRSNKENGSNFVTISQLMGSSRDAVMPRVSPKDRFIVAASSFGLSTLNFLEEFLWAFMIVASLMVLLRNVFIGTAAFLQKRRAIISRTQKNKIIYHPAISILMPAFNEEKVITKSIRSVLANGYPGEFEVVVVDDGSKDATLKVMKEEFGENSRVKIHTQKNAGKSTALELALSMAKHDILVSLDADTQLDPGTLQELARPFRDESIGAVSGNARVGNRGRWLTEFQSLEYICSFNLDRRAYDLFNCITVVPGAIGAYRRAAVEKAGGFTPDTLAEDTDLTLTIRKNGWRIVFAEKAVAWTESPETIRDLVKQRFRWAFGTLQCLWKHRDALFSLRYGALGWIALPSIWIFHMGLVALAPAVDFLMLFSFFAGNGSEVVLYFVAFLFSDILLACFAMKLEGEKLSHGFYIIPQRFVYRPLLSFVVWKAMIRSLSGAWVGWSKVERTARVQVKHAA